MNEYEQSDSVASKSDKEAGNDLSSSIWDDIKQSASDAAKSISNVFDKDGSLDLSGNIYGDALTQQAKVPLGEVQPGDKKLPAEPAADAQPEIEQQEKGEAKPFNPDDVQMITMEDGTQIFNYPELGKMSVKSPDGTEVYYDFNDGSKYTKNPDGTTIMEDAEGNKWTKDKDGKLHSEHVSLIGKLWDMIPTFD